MGNKRKNGAASFGWGLLSIVAALLGTTAGLSAVVTLSASMMVEAVQGTQYYGRWMMKWLDETVRNDFVSKGTAVAIAAAVLFITCLTALLITCGRSVKNQDGTIYINWFDKIWSELQIIGAAALGIAAICVSQPLFDIIPRDSYLGFYMPGLIDKTYYGPSNESIALLCASGMLVSVWLCVIFAASLVKKLKARKFWEHSIIGGIILGISRRYRNSSEVTVKVTVLMCVCAVLCGTWVGIPIVVALILIFVPKVTKRYEEIRSGVDQVKSGNLDYKIPVCGDENGVKGELDRLAESINEISCAAGAAVQNEIKNQKTKTELISNVSHDLKTPMTSIISYVDLMKQEGLDGPNAPEYLRILDEKTQRLKTLTENLFEAAKASSGDMPCEITDIDMAELVSQALGEMDEKLRERGLEPIVKTDAGSSMVRADGQLLWRVIENLLSNVSKYALENSRVYVDIKDAPESLVILEVKNISRDALNISSDELMERFKRGDESRATEGSGLGLSIARDLTALMGGKFAILVDGDLFKAQVALPAVRKL